MREEGLKAHEAVEALFKKKQQTNEDPEPGDNGVPNIHEVEEAWAMANKHGALIAAARNNERPSKSERRALQAALAKPAVPSILPYLLSGVLTAANVQDQW